LEAEEDIDIEENENENKKDKSTNINKKLNQEIFSDDDEDNSFENDSFIDNDFIEFEENNINRNYIKQDKSLDHLFLLKEKIMENDQKYIKEILKNSINQKNKITNLKHLVTKRDNEVDLFQNLEDNFKSKFY
jgi:hypothetical protein